MTETDYHLANAINDQSVLFLETIISTKEIKAYNLKPQWLQRTHLFTKKMKRCRYSFKNNINVNFKLKSLGIFLTN